MLKLPFGKRDKNKHLLFSRGIISGLAHYSVFDIFANLGSLGFQTLVELKIMLF